MANATAVMKESMKQTFHTQHEEWKKLISGLSAEALNWKPGEETNSIAALVAHSCEAERFLIAVANGIVPDRDREGQFQVSVSGPDELTRIIAETEPIVDGYIDSLTGDLLASEHALPGRVHSGAWWSLRAIEHSREHLGQALLTRQMYEQRG
jgi:hypothetical protein